MKEKDFLPILKEKFGIEELNDMQKKMIETSSQSQDIILLSPTGSGKTLAFILPVLKMLKASSGRVQVVVIAPSRELVVQIASVFREVAKDHRVVPLYGGHKVEDEVNSLKIVPDIIVATPGRLLDHSARHNTELLPVRILVLDEFDKSLELGFEEEMKKLIGRMKNVSRYILTSATSADILPDFLKLDQPAILNFLNKNEDLKKRITQHKVVSDNVDKLDTLYNLLLEINSKNSNIDVASDKLEKTIIFVNHRESAERVYNFLRKKGVSAVLYHGALDQRERETAIALFNHGSRPILVATDLASRGLDIENVESVVHYHQPLTTEVNTHRNGRTARVDKEGDVYFIIGPDEELKDFIETENLIRLSPRNDYILDSNYITLYINAGKREKLSKGDILGFLTKDAGISVEDIGKIDVFDHYSLVTIKNKDYKMILKQIEGKKIKGVKRKITIY